LYAGLLSPKQYSSRGHELDLRRLTRFVEAFAYFSPAHAYSLHVSFLGLFPILQGANEPLKREAVAALEGGGLFAFAVSERAHGSDLLANEFTVSPAGVADGEKFYIGNVNAASIITVLARRAERGVTPSRRAPFLFFALRPQGAPGFGAVRKIRTLGIRAAFVGEFRVTGHLVPPADVISEGRAAWEAAFGTVDFGKFFLGFGAIGICERALAESLAHMRRRVLYGKPVIDLPHIRTTTAAAFARLMAMKFYACRALDYLQAAGPTDRRYLLFNAVQKARVSTEGVKVLSLLSECVGARGFEAESFFEMALREAPMIPGLEGSTHINFGVAAQFMANYFAHAADGPSPPASVIAAPQDPGENPYWFGPRDGHPKTVRFPPCLAAYRPFRGVGSVRRFVTQVKAFREFAKAAAEALAGDPALLIAAGRCFTAVAYGQLVAEACALGGARPTVVSPVFHRLVEDVSAEALRLAAMFPAGHGCRRLIQRAVRIPEMTAEEVTALIDLLAEHFPS
jgi:acyl-CoA dehydrogenase